MYSFSGSYSPPSPAQIEGISQGRGKWGAQGRRGYFTGVE